MAVRVIVKEPDPILRQVSQEVRRITPNIHKLLDDMAETMYDAGGVGLAAVQVGVLKRVVVIDVGEGLIELINPVITSREGEQIGPEGCLSIPGLVGEVKRAMRCTVEALNRHGEPIVVEGEGYLARALQHEIDHLNGILFTDLTSVFYQSEKEPD
ncbi:MAG: peptide deformylase [Bacillus thermozeamaize]|jgi:peptide deformylase|uniref:Peptide deformylase n=1 Tax=Bacillus thermozeamaize TaxID=230954 RepID=A0A1Y3PK26_9BACI|nr:MAG: peptide deformylase [Bacillus thermozeamaize]